MLIAQIWILAQTINSPEFLSEEFTTNMTKFEPHFARRRANAEIKRVVEHVSKRPTPIAFLFDFMPWRARSQSRCDAIFGNGFDGTVVQCPQIRCDRNTVTHATLCVANDLVLDRGKITVSSGGEKIEDVIGRDEASEYPVYAAGAFSIPNACLIGDINGDNFPHHLSSMIRSLAHEKSSPRPECHDGVTLLVTRYEYANLYHTMTDWYNTFQAWAAVADSSRDLQIIFMDGHSQGSLDPAWTTLFGVTPTFVASLPERSCFRQTVLVPAGYTSALSVDMMNIADACNSAPLARNFAQWFVSRFGLRQVRPSSACPKILFIFRRDYLAHPRIQGRPASRKIENEKELLDQTAAAFPHATIESSEFERIAFAEQIRAVRSATVLIGVHGAALSHILLAESNTTLIELMPPEYSARNHFMMFAKYVGAGYDRVQIGSETVHGYHHVPVDHVIQSLQRILAR